MGFRVELADDRKMSWAKINKDLEHLPQNYLMCEFSLLLPSNHVTCQQLRWRERERLLEPDAGYSGPLQP